MMTEPDRLGARSAFRRRRDALLHDFRRSWDHRHLAFELARTDTFARVRLTALGPFWLMAQPLIWMLAILVLIRPEAATESPLFPLYVATGIVLFLGLQTFLAGGASLFKRERNRILNVPLPLSVFAMKNATSVALELAVMAPIIAVTMVFYTPPLGATQLLLLPGLAIYFAFGLGVTLLLSVLAARFADVVFIVQAAMRGMLFLTPIFWLPDRTHGARMIFSQFNPLHHVILVVRDPLMGKTPDTLHYVVASACAATALAAGILLFARFRERIAIWI